MRLIRLFFAALFVYLFWIALATSITFTGCTKTKTVHDTTILTFRDTVTIKDTITVIDSIWNIRSGLVAYYNFNAGNLIDSSGHNNNISFSNAILTSDRLGNANNAYLFDGKSSYMEVPNSSSINPNNITLFAILKVNGFYTGQCHINAILNKGASDNVNGLYALRFDDSSLIGATSCSAIPDTANEFFYGSFGDNTGGHTVTSSGWDSLKIQKGEWYTIAMTYDGTLCKFYLDGALVSTTSKTVSFTDNGNNLFIGKTESSIFPYYFKGVIDELRIYNRAIPGPQISELNFLKSKYVRFGNKLIY